MNRSLPLFYRLILIVTIIVATDVFSRESNIVSEQNQVFELLRKAKLSLANHKIEAALDYYEQALSHAGAQSEPLLTAAIHNLLGLANEQGAEFQRALRHFEQGLGILSNQGDDTIAPILRSVLERLGGMRKGYWGSSGAPMGTGLYRGEIEDIKQFFNREKKLVLAELAILLLLNDANMYLQQNQFVQADSIYVRAVKISRDSRFDLLTQKLYNNLAWSSMKRDQFDQARAWLDSLTKISPSTLSSIELRHARLAQGLVNRKRNNYPQAIADIQQAILFYQQANDKRGECKALSHLANTYLLANDFDNASKNYLRALKLNQTVNDKEAAWFANGGLAKYYHRMKEFDRALQHFDAYFKSIREIQQNFLYDQGKVSFLESQGEMMDAYVTTAVAVAEQKNKYAIARPIIEKLRSGSLVDLQYSTMARQHSKPGHLPAEYVIFHDQPAEQNRVRSELRAVGLLPGGTRGLSIEQRAPGVESMMGPIPDRNELPEDEIKTLPDSELPPITFLEYWILAEQTIIFVKSSSGAINGAVVKINADTLEKWVADYCAKLEVGDTRGMTISRNAVPIVRRATGRSMAELSRQLYQLLIAPVSKYLPRDPQQPIAIVPNRWLWQLPFAALQDEQNHYFGDQQLLTYAGSEQSWKLIARRPRDGDHRAAKAWIIGNPRMPEPIEACESTLSFGSLPGAAAEATAIANLFEPGHAEVFTGSHADRLRLEAWHSDFSILHFATHGFACPEKPLSSFIVLSALDSNELKIDTTSFQISLTGDPRYRVKLDSLKQMLDYPWAWWNLSRIKFPGILNAWTISNRFSLKADLVTLSACQTGLGKFTGEGNIGFSRAFLKAGARSFLVSLWRVADEATKELMIAFYREYLDHGNKALALQQAMQQTRQRFPHPKYWAAFTLNGMAE